MKITDYKQQGSDGRLVLTGMIVSDQVAGAVAQKWIDDGLFDSAYLDRIGGWCVKHFKEYNRAPRQSIMNYHRRWSATRRRPTDEDSAIENFLAGLSQEYIRREQKTIQADYVIKVATDLFTGVAIDRATEQAKDLVASGKINKAVEVMSKLGKVDMTDEDMVDVLEDKAVIRSAFKESSEPLVVYPGAAGDFFGTRLKRRAFVAFEGPEKRGKSFWILDVAWRGMMQGRKVAYFELGDMPREDVVMRLASRAARRPVDPAELDANGGYQYPVSIEPSENRDRCEVVLQDRRIETKMTWKEAYSIFSKKVTRYGKGLFKLSCNPTKTLSVAGLQQKLEQQKTRHGWIPDIVCCDYAELFSPMNGTADTRDQINLTWAMLRSLAMQWNCLVVTATQSNRGSYDTEVIDMEHTSDDKRKLGFVTLMVGLNQSDEEKDKGVYRLNKVVARTGKYSKRKCLSTAGCLAVANPCVLSVY